MKANELMIGDWCRMKLTFGTQWYTDKVGCVNPENELEYEPIRLTKEILFANGFKGNGCKGVLVHPDYKNLQVYYEIDHFEGEDWIVKEWSVMGICGIEYVHEFQHYLRLISKNDLADNFKLQA